MAEPAREDARVATVDEAFAMALGLHRAGRLNEAAAIHRSILEAAPGHAESWHLLGVIALQHGRPAEAVERIGRAVALRDGVPLFHVNLAKACRAAGRGADAVGHLRRAVALRPDPDALRELGSALLAEGEAAEAVGVLERLLVLAPDDADALGDLGNALLVLDRLDEALERYQSALAARPGHAVAHYNLANALVRRRRLDEAMEHYRRALAARPDFPEAHNNLGKALSDLDRLDEAAAAYERALALRPDFAEALNNLGNARLDQGRVGDSIEAYRRALAVSPDYAEALGNLGNALRVDGRLAESLEAAGRCLALGRAVRGWEVMAATHLALGDPVAAEACYRAAVAAGGGADLHSRLLMTMQYCDTVGAPEIAAEAARWARRHTAGITPRAVWPGRAFDPGRPLRVGVLSGDFRLCSTPFLALPLLRERPADWALSLYSTVRKTDHWTGVFRGLADGWVEISGLDEDEAAARILADGVDVLIDLNGHTVGGRPGVFARKPAPVQVAWLDYVGTTGLATLDAIIGDDGHLPPGDQRWYVEPIRRVAADLYRYEPPEGAPALGPPPALARGHVTFGCFNAAYKLTAATLDLWARVLAAVPTARLLLNAREFARRETRERALGLLAARGVAPGRVEARPGAEDPRAMLLAYGEVDIALDTMPYSGGLTTLEALYMGVPVVTVPGDRFGSRHSMVHLRALGLDDWVAADAAGYVERAARAAANPEALARLRAGLRGRLRASPLMDGAAFALDLSAIVRDLWRSACARSAP